MLRFIQPSMASRLRLSLSLSHLQVSPQAAHVQHPLVLLFVVRLAEQDVVPHAVVGDPGRLRDVGQGAGRVHVA